MTLEHTTGKIEFAEQQNTFILKLSGEVRLTLCNTLDCAIEKLLKQHQFTQVIVDLTQAVSLDSTTLGLLAKLAIFTQQTFHCAPQLLTTNEDIIRLLESMGVKEAFTIEKQATSHWDNLKDLPINPCSETAIKEKIIEAHRILMELNDTNKAAFKDLIDTLEK